MPRLLGSILVLAALAVASCAPRIEPAGPPIEAPRLAGDAIVAADGARLPLRSWLPKGRPRAVILALHGFNDYSKAFEAPAEFWASRGIATYAYDQRGFGRAPNRGLWPGQATLVSDAREAAKLVRARNPGVPFVLLGVSMGGAVAMLAASEPAGPPIAKRTVLVAPAVWGRRYMGVVPRALLWLAANTVPWLRLTGQGTGVIPSDNIAMLRALGEDPEVIKETRVDTIKGLVDLMDAALAAAPHLRGQILFLYGAHDDLVPPDPVFQVIRELPKTARVALYDTGYHMLLRDLKAELPRADIAAWIADPAAPLPSGADAQARRVLEAADPRNAFAKDSAKR